MKLLTKEIRQKLPRLYGQDGMGEEAIVYAKFFTPDSNWTWFVLEGEPIVENDKEIDFRFFGLVHGFEEEYGYFMLSELESVTGPMGLHIERDLHFGETKVSGCKNPCS